MNYEVYQDLKKEVKSEDFYTKYQTLKNWLFRLSWAGNIFCIVFAYFHVNSAIIQTISNPTTTTVVLVAGLTVLILFALEGLKRIIFNKLTKSLVERDMKWVGAELNVLAGLSILLVSASFYLSLTGAQEYADKKDVVATQVESNVTAYTDSLEAKYDRKIKVIEDRNAVMFTTNTDLTTKAQELTPRRRADLMRAIDANNKIISGNESSIKDLKKEKEAELVKFEAKQKEKGAAIVESGNSNIIRFVSFSAIAEIIILLGVAFRGYFPYKSKLEFDKLIEKDPKYKQYEQFSELLRILYKNDVKVGDNIVTKTEITKMLKIAGVDLYGKYLDETFRVLRHLGIIQKRGSKNVIKLEREKAKLAIREYLKID